MNNFMKLAEALCFFVPPYKTATLHVRSRKFAQIWYFCMLKVVVDIMNNDVYGLPDSVRHYVSGKVLSPLTSCSISISEMLYGNKIMNDLGNIIYVNAKKYFKYYRKQMGLKGPRRIGLGEKILMLQMAYWFRYGIWYIINIPDDIIKNLNTIFDKYGAKNFGGLDDTEYVTYDHKVEMYLWNKIIRESSREYKGIDMNDILDPVRENWKVVYNGPEVLKSSDAPRKPIPIDYVP